MDKKKRLISVVLLIVCLLLSGCGGESSPDKASEPEQPVTAAGEENSAPVADETAQFSERAADVRIAESFDPADVPEYSGSPYIEINGGNPGFTEEDLTTTSFENYSELDELGRCGVSYSNIGEDLMPAEKRGSIGKVKPSGWHSAEYDIVDGKSLYNRCHLIGYQLTAENANEKNLITGTRYLNTEGMLPFENMVADYIKETGNHVLYRVTPFFEADNLVASGVQMEAMSVEDEGEGILFNVYCYNVQPGILIDYATGDSQLSGEAVSNGTAGSEAVSDGAVSSEAVSDGTAGSEAVSDGAAGSEAVSDEEGIYILNTNTHKYHKPSCSSVKQIKEANMEEYTGSRNDLDAMGYDSCKRCRP